MRGPVLYENGFKQLGFACLSDSLTGAGGAWSTVNYPKTRKLHTSYYYYHRAGLFACASCPLLITQAVHLFADLSCSIIILANRSSIHQGALLTIS